MLRSESHSPLAGPAGTGRSYWAISIRRLLRKRVAVICLTLILIMYGSAILAPLVTPYEYNDQNLSIAKQGPSVAHPFGTDRLGRDVLTRIIYGLRTTVVITVVTLATGSLVLGVSLGLVAGYFGRFVDTVIMRVGEVTSAFPDLFLVLIIVSTVRPPMTEWLRGVEDTLGVEIVRLGVADYVVLSLSLAIFSWFGMARLVRGQVLQAREDQYIEAARSIGSSTPRILLRHLLPNIMGPVIVMDWDTTAGPKPGIDDLRKRQHIRPALESPPPPLSRGHPGGASLHLQPAGRRGKRRLQPAGPLDHS